MNSSYQPGKRLRLPNVKHELIRSDNYSDVSSECSDLPDLENDAGYNFSQGDVTQIRSYTYFPTGAENPALTELNNSPALSGGGDFHLYDYFASSNDTFSSTCQNPVSGTSVREGTCHESSEVKVFELSSGSPESHPPKVTTGTNKNEDVILSHDFHKYFHEHFNEHATTVNTKAGSPNLFNNISESDSDSDDNEITRTSVFDSSQSTTLVEECHNIKLPTLTTKKPRSDGNSFDSLKYSSKSSCLAENLDNFVGNRNTNDLDNCVDKSSPDGISDFVGNRNTNDLEHCVDKSSPDGILGRTSYGSHNVPSIIPSSSSFESSTDGITDVLLVSKEKSSSQEHSDEAGNIDVSDIQNIFVDLTQDDEINSEPIIITTSEDDNIPIGNLECGRRIFGTHRKRKLHPIDNKVPVLKLARIDVDEVLASSYSSFCVSSPEKSEKKSKVVTRKRNSSARSSKAKGDDLLPLDFQFNKLCLSDSITVDENCTSPVEDLNENSLSAIEACLDNSNKDFAISGIYLMYPFSKDYKIPEKTAALLFQQLFLESENLTDVLQCYFVFRFLLRKQQNLLKFKWEKLSEFLNKIVYSGAQGNNSLLTVKGILYLQLMVDVLTREILGMDLDNLAKIRSTLTYKTLSSDCSFSNQKQIVQWLSPLLSKHPLNTIQFNLPSLGLNIEGIDAHYVEIPPVIPLLQKLLVLGVDVSSHSMECAKRLSHLLAKTYIYLPELSQKTVLIKSIRSKLLRFKLIQNILENYSDRSSMCAEDFPVSLSVLVESYYSCYPPRNESLLTPSDDEFDGRATPARHTEEYFMAECEELSMLLYYLTYSYLKCSYRNQHEQLKNRAKRSKQQLQSLHIIDSQSMEKLPRFVKHLQNHLERIIGDLSPGCLVYLDLMTGLATISEDR